MLIPADPTFLTHDVPASRIESTTGDIARAYSANMINQQVPHVRNPFEFQGERYATVAIAGCKVSGTGRAAAWAYRLADERTFDGTPMGYWEKHKTGRQDPLGFYHGIKVLCEGYAYVMCGPKVRFDAGYNRMPPLPTTLCPHPKRQVAEHC
jgi:hypothetical protein